MGREARDEDGRVGRADGKVLWTVVRTMTFTPSKIGNYNSIVRLRLNSII